MKEQVIFASHYLVNVLPRADIAAEENALPYFRTTDFVRGTGMSLSLDIRMKPRSGFRFRIIIFQTPYGLAEIAEEHKDVIRNNGSFPGSTTNPQGGYSCNSGIVSQHAEANNGLLCRLTSPYAELFKDQKATFDTVNVHDTFMSCKITKPYVSVLWDGKTKFVNRSGKPKTFKWNKFLPMNTTWRYPPAIHDGLIAESVTNKPDRKVFIMIFGVPFSGHFEDIDVPSRWKHPAEWDVDECPPMFKHGDMPSVVVDEDTDKKGKKADRMEDDVDIEKERGKRKRGRMSLEPGPPEAGPSKRPRSSYVTATNAAYLNNPDAAIMHDALLTALRQDRADRFAEVERMKKDHSALPDSDYYKVETDSFGWALDQAILFRPTIRVWFKPEYYKATKKPMTFRRCRFMKMFPSKYRRYRK